MADVVYRDPDRGSGTALGVIIGVLLVLTLLFGAWWLFFRGPAVVDEPNTTIIEQEQAPPPDVNIEQEQQAPGGGGTDTEQQEAPDGGGTTAPEEEPAP